MMKQLIVLIFVTLVHHSVNGLTFDAQSKSEECFIKTCRVTFLMRIFGYPLCGSDNKPYIHAPSFACAQDCAVSYGLELTEAYKGDCKGKPPALQYWKESMNL